MNLLTPTVKRLVEDRVKTLEANNDYVARQVQFLSQRLEDFKKQLRSDVMEVQELKVLLAGGIIAPPPPETRRGLSDPDEGMDGFGN